MQFMNQDIFGFSLDKRWDYENGWYLTSGPERLAKVIAHWELYRSIINLPGDVAEFGVYKGASFIRWCTFRSMLESASSRRILGFDAFGKFPRQGDLADQSFVEGFEATGGDGIPKEQLQGSLSIKGFHNVELIAGDVCSTLPAYVESRPESKFALVHVDVDVYEPTRVILEQIYDRIVPGGLIVFDDYAIIPGETRAADEFFASRGGARFEKLPFSHTPSYLRKV